MKNVFANLRRFPFLFPFFFLLFRNHFIPLFKFHSFFFFYNTSPQFRKQHRSVTHGVISFVCHHRRFASSVTFWECKHTHLLSPLFFAPPHLKESEQKHTRTLAAAPIPNITTHCQPNFTALNHHRPRARSLIEGTAAIIARTLKYFTKQQQQQKKTHRPRCTLPKNTRCYLSLLLT